MITNRVFLWRSKASRGAYPSAQQELQVGKSDLEMLLWYLLLIAASVHAAWERYQAWTNGLSHFRGHLNPPVLHREVLHGGTWAALKQIKHHLKRINTVLVLPHLCHTITGPVQGNMCHLQAAQRPPGMDTWTGKSKAALLLSSHCGLPRHSWCYTHPFPMSESFPMSLISVKDG